MSSKREGKRPHRDVQEDSPNTKAAQRCLAELLKAIEGMKIEHNVESILQQHLNAAGELIADADKRVRASSSTD
jgi:hypothetical protein